jgi:hypothetical protein
MFMLMFEWCQVVTIYIGAWRKRIKAKTSQHNFFITWDRSHEVFHEYKLPCTPVSYIEQM